MSELVVDPQAEVVIRDGFQLVSTSGRKPDFTGGTCGEVVVGSGQYRRSTTEPDVVYLLRRVCFWTTSPRCVVPPRNIESRDSLVVVGVRLGNGRVSATAVGQLIYVE